MAATTGGALKGTYPILVLLSITKNFGVSDLFTACVVLLSCSLLFVSQIMVMGDQGAVRDAR